ncbi:Zn-ribbon domain-containing OB-fold protein [Advenella sp. FME57]|uniref:Zn-ribbon domain-containing OB-fold protein n=1 Tax=Advenella sp. FME57 TaxID=2742604 RepID=UPI00186883BB|nr:Zn-ribbon domain-containing OB-fold protein [Advenella sp. FME57]
MTVSNQALDTGADKYYHTQLQAGVFTIQRCGQCNNSIFYPRMICPHCGSDDLQWYEPSGKGTVYSTTVVRNKPEKGGDYNVALIDLEEGPRMMSRVEQITPDEVKIGLAVSARIKQTDDSTLLVFVPAGDQA